jgi:hypothetical protein
MYIEHFYGGLNEYLFHQRVPGSEVSAGACYVSLHTVGVYFSRSVGQSRN